MGNADGTTRLPWRRSVGQATGAGSGAPAPEHPSAGGLGPGRNGLARRRPPLPFGLPDPVVGSAGSRALVGDHLAPRHADDRSRQICHDVSTPAVTIRLLAEQVLARGSLAPDSADMLRQVLHETERIAEICGSVLGQPRAQRVVRLDRIAAEVVDSARHATQAAVDAELRPALVLAHGVGLRRLLANLVDNAICAAGSPGQVGVTVLPARSGARLQVVDSGPGPGPWTALLQPVGARRLAPGSRAGIGLSVVARVAEECGATVTVGRSRLGGTAVTVVFPPAPGVASAAG